MAIPINWHILSKNTEQFMFHRTVFVYVAYQATWVVVKQKISVSNLFSFEQNTVYYQEIKKAHIILFNKTIMWQKRYVYTTFKSSDFSTFRLPQPTL